jgi:ring-1,2-phenylacetyl-CoA epoxidase subunit PaaD
MVNATAAATAYEVAAGVVDPELRVVTIADLGILRAVDTDGDRVQVTITPTYAGCPAMDVIRQDVAAALRRAGWSRVEVVTRLHPAWSTDRITEVGRRKLAEAGFAPPGAARTVSLGLPGSRPPDQVACPRCGSDRTAELSRFGATPCKALWRCDGCGDPFEYVKSL